MRLTAKPLIFGILCLVAGPIAGEAALRLRGIMQNWRDDARNIKTMLASRDQINEAAVREILQTYARDAARVAGQVSGSGPEARDFQGRFTAFQADAQRALGNLGQHASLRLDMLRLMSDCQSCHDQHKD